MTKRETESLRLRAEIFKALGHPTRLWIVEALAEGERCVADLADGVEGGLSAVSQHLAQLRQAGIVRDERRGRQIYYSLTFPSVAEVCALLGGGAVRRPSRWARLRQVLPAAAVGMSFAALVGAGLFSAAANQKACRCGEAWASMPPVPVVQHEKGKPNHENIICLRRFDGRGLRVRPGKASVRKPGGCPLGRKDMLRPGRRGLPGAPRSQEGVLHVSREGRPMPLR